MAGRCALDTRSPSKSLDSSHGIKPHPERCCPTGRLPLAADPLPSLAIRSVDAQVAITDVRTMSQVMARSTGRARFYLTMLGVFAGVALVLAVSGIYGVLSYAVAHRTREFGIRSALGSTPATTLALVTREGLTLIGLGIVLGLVGSMGATRFRRHALRREPSGPRNMGGDDPDVGRDRSSRDAAAGDQSDSS